MSVAVEIAVALGIAGVVGFFALADSPALLWQSVLVQMVQPILEVNPDVPIDDVKKSILMFSHFMTGAIAAGVVYGLLFSLFLARWWQAVLFNPGGFREEYLSLSVSRKVATLSLVVGAIASLMTGTVSEVCWNIVILFAVLYTFVGAAILHATFSEMKIKRFMVPFMYVTLVLVPHMLLIVISVGLVDAWLDLRSKILNQKGT